MKKKIHSEESSFAPQIETVGRGPAGPDAILQGKNAKE
jgi:hypothetical protein